MSICTSYLYAVLHNPLEYRQTVDRMIAIIERAEAEYGKYDCLACRGTSGIVAAAPLSLLLQKQLIVVRKKCDLESTNGTYNSHANRLVEGVPDAKTPFNFLFVDDLVCSGRTLTETINAIQEVNKEATPSGALLYCSDIVLFPKLRNYKNADGVYMWDTEWNPQINSSTAPYVPKREIGNRY